MNRIRAFGVRLGSATMMLVLLRLCVFSGTAEGDEPSPDGNGNAEAGVVVVQEPAADTIQEPNSDAEQQAAATSSVPTEMLPSSGASPTQPLGDLLNFQMDLFTGRFSYRVPIIVPPGRQNSQPGIALGYNSSGGNGWCGVGWSLDMGFIQRETRYGVPHKWGATSPLNEYDDTKGFIFSMAGASGRLSYITGTNPAEYRMETDNGSFLTFEYYPYGPYWLVTDKNGNKFWFGNTADSKMQHPTWSPATAGLKTFRWAINEIQDANGNKTTFSYATVSNQLYLSQIAYNGHTAGITPAHTVTFNTEARPDTNIVFTSGYRVTSLKRLQNIEIKIGTTQVRKYSLVYTNSPSTYRSLLSEIKQFGSDWTTNLPPLKFTYQVKPFEFDSTQATPTNWPGVFSQGDTSASWNSIRAGIGGADFFVEFLDMDADGLPDRVMRKHDAPYQEYFAVQRNTGRGFEPTNGFYQWLNLTNQNQTALEWNYVRSGDGGETWVDLLDLNGDGLLDRVLRKINSPYVYWGVQTNLGFRFSDWFQWGPITNVSAAQDWNTIRWAATVYVDVCDLNGDGWLDRVSRKLTAPYTVFKVQFNSGSGFGPLVDWGPVNVHHQTNSTLWSAVYGVSAGDTLVGLYDINGDGLPDRVAREYATPYDQFAVQFNNGAGFEPWESWGPLDSQGQTGSQWNCPVGTNSGDTTVTLVDINGDGLPDRVMRAVYGPYDDHWVVQFNTGNGFTSAVNWGGIYSQGNTLAAWNTINYVSTGYTQVDLVDINGDALPDRVMRKLTSPYNYFAVQLNKGPFPDLLAAIDNSLSGRVEVVYAPSTGYDNRDRPWSGDPWSAGAKSLLPFPVWTVKHTIVKDGFGSADTNTYAYAGGMFDFQLREFNGFNRVTVTDPLGAKSVTHFHQGGGTNDVPNGEHDDIGAVAKRGVPYRTVLIGSDGLTNSITLNKVMQQTLHTNGWYFPYIAQTIALEYEGLSTYRATAKQFSYEFASLNLTNETNLGEVGTVTASTHSFTDIGSDSIYTWLTYSTLGNGAIKPATTKITSDAGGATKLRETTFSYNTAGNLTRTLSWLNPGNTYITNSIGYDTYGNANSVTNPVGIVTRTLYESTYQTFPVTTITGTFTNTATFDVRSGAAITATDVKGQVSSNYFDVFYRLKETYVSTNATGAPQFVWRTKVDYNLGGVAGGLSQNYVRQRVFDAVDLTNGLESYGYFDGIGRAVQSRAEAETGQFRVADTFYNERGQVEFVTLPYFSSGTSFTAPPANPLGALNAFDAIGRVVSNVSPAFADGTVGSDTGSPVGWTQVAYKDGTNPWATFATDSEGKTRKSFHDAYGRVTQITEHGSINTSFAYDKLGNLTNVTDSAGNKTWMTYDSLGRKTAMTDPDMGTWSYVYDAAGRMTEQTDAKSQKLKFIYNDELGRLTKKEIYSSGGSFVTNVVYAYDVSDDGNYTVYKGQLYKVSDRQGWQKNSYDFRGRVVKAGRYLSVNSQTYVVESTYDDADRAKTVKYPGGATKLQYTYDTGGNLKKVESTCGTGSNEVFWQLGALNALGQIGSYTNGNGVVTTNSYFANSKRIQKALTFKGTNTLQNLDYTFDKVANVKSITDNKYTGSQGGSLSSISYDDLHRLTGYTWNSTTYSFTYNAIGNTTVNGEMGVGTYTYGSSKPHAVTSANRRSYSYDACGNMTNRNGTALLYDEENQLKQYGSITFGYADGGARLWKNNGGTLTIWIGGIYEIKGSQTLCHVFAGGQRVATFEPITPACALLYHDPFIAPVYEFFCAATTWPLQEGRAPLTATLIPLLGILGASVISRKRTQRAQSSWNGGRLWGCGSALPGAIGSVLGGWALNVECSTLEPSPSLQRRYSRIQLRSYHSWQKLLLVLLTVAITVTTTHTDVYAATCSPVFWYYHGDHLGSSNIMTDRSGALVDHYEYHAFGKARYDDGTCSFNVANRFTGQILDEDTGLYYYGSRYYDPELGRFVQADTIVPGAGDPQTLNRYSYCNNNPLKYVDPSGHDFGLSAVIIGVVVGAAVGAGAAAAQGGNILMGALTGAIGGLTGGLGAWAGAAIGAGGAAIGTTTGSLIGAVVGGTVGGAVGGAITAAIMGGDIGLGAAAGAVGGALGGLAGLAGIKFNWSPAVQATTQVFSGSLSGGVSSVLHGGSFGEGAMWGAAGAGIAIAAVGVVRIVADILNDNQVKTDNPDAPLKIAVLYAEAVGRADDLSGVVPLFEKALNDLRVEGLIKEGDTVTAGTISKFRDLNSYSDSDRIFIYAHGSASRQIPELRNTPGIYYLGDRLMTFPVARQSYRNIDCIVGCNPTQGKIGGAAGFSQVMGNVRSYLARRRD